MSHGTAGMRVMIKALTAALWRGITKVMHLTCLLSSPVNRVWVRERGGPSSGPWECTAAD